MHIWLFDLDGTLTVPMHDFAGLKAELGLPADLDVLAGIATRPIAERAALHDAVKRWEVEHLDHARPAPGAHDLLESLLSAACRVGILTRNTRVTALNTLDAVGLRGFFDDDVVVGRECTEPKPSPAGVHRLLRHHGAPPHEALLVGDYVDDLRAARAASVQAVWIDHDGSGAYAAEADRTIGSLTELHPLVPPFAGP